MSQLLNGSICLSDLNAKAKEGHSAFSRAKNGKIYFNITQWINDEPDQYGNHSSFQLNSKKDNREAEGKVYIGHAKFAERQEPSPVNPESVSGELPDDDDLPF